MAPFIKKNKIKLVLVGIFSFVLLIGWSSSVLASCSGFCGDYSYTQGCWCDTLAFGDYCSDICTYCSSVVSGCTCTCTPGSTQNCYVGNCGTQTCQSNCTWGTCTLKPAWCLIGGTCYSNWTRNPSNECQWCDSSKSTNSWTNLETSGYPGVACTDDGKPCTKDICSGSTCTHPAGNAGTVCRAAGANATCDPAETCDGVSTACPANVYAANTTDCGICAKCNGSGSCVYDSTQNADCSLCKKCTALGTCGNQTSEDLKDECAQSYTCPTICSKTWVSGLCNGGACAAGVTTDCSYGYACSSGFCISAQCDSTDYCAGNTWYSGKKCNGAGSCNANDVDIGCCMGSKCSAGNYCRESDHSCQPVPVCQVRNETGFGTTNVTNGTACTDDSNPCTIDSCSAGACTHTAGLCPSTPTNFSATAVFCKQINLSWSDVSNETSYAIERTYTGVPWTQIATPGQNATSYDDTAVNPSVTYSYRIKAINGAGSSDWSSTAPATTPACPTVSCSLSATPSSLNQGQSSTISASVSGTAVGTINYSFWANCNSSCATVSACQTACGAPPVPPKLDGTNTNPYSFSQVYNTVGTNYSRMIVERDGATPAACTATVIVSQPVPAAPSNLTATATSTTQINLFWTDNSNNETGFKIERKTGASTIWFEIATSSANVTSYQNTGLTSGTLYTYRVRSYNATGDSAYSNEASTPTIPSPPTNVTATAVSGDCSKINISWTASTGATKYYILRYTTATGGTSASAGETSNPYFQDSGLNSGTTYYYEVQAYNSAGTSVSSSPPQSQRDNTAQSLYPALGWFYC